MTELDRTVEYSYDSLYRLTSETITEGEKVTVYTYAYDNVSNRILKTENGSATEYVYNALNQLVSDSETTYEYDLNGNLIRVIGTANSALYEYNAENKLVKATVQNGVLVTEESYTYDYEGNRTSKTTHRSDGVTEYVKYLNDNSSLTNVLAEMGSEGSVQAYYTIGADLVSQERDGNVSVYLYDGHGSVVGLANESGVVTDSYVYDAFGNLISSTGSTENNYRYCGEQFDETTGLYYLRARYMDTSTGRFISQDSYSGSISDPISLHKFLYANANPVTYSDPSGCLSEVSVGILPIFIIEVQIATPLLVSAVICPTLGVAAIEVKYNEYVVQVGINIIACLRAVEPILAFGSIFGNQIVAVIHQLVSGMSNSLSMATDVAESAIEQTQVSYDNDPPTNSQTTKEKRRKDNYVYFGFRNTNVVYVGITNNIAKRALQHGKRFDFISSITQEPLSRIHARGVEQVLIERNKPPKGIFENKINSISPLNFRYASAHRFGEQYLETNTKYQLLKRMGKVN